VAKVCYVITGLDIGGAELQLYQIIRRINPFLFSPVVISLLEFGPVKEKFIEAGIPIYSLKMKKKLRGFISNQEGIYRFFKILRKEKPDIVVLFMYHAIILGRLIGKLAGIHHIISSFRISPAGDIKGRMQNLILRSTSWIDDLTCVNSERVATEWVAKKVIIPQKLRVIPNGVDLPKFNSTHRRSRPKDVFTWVAIGRLVPQKDFLTLIEAFKRVADVFPRSSLEIVGDGPLRKKLEDKSRDMGIENKVRVAGICESIPALLARANALVLSSVWEGMPNVILEAMAAGLPVVATDVGGVQELVTDGENGFLVPPKNSVALADAMTRLMKLTEEERERMGRRGKEIARRYDIEKIAKQWEKLFKEVLRS